MTATDELRARLNELGVEWWDIETNDKSQTLTVCIVDDVRCKYRKVGRGFIVSTCTEGSVTLEQAITATVGRDMCHDTGEDPMRFVCSECGGVEGETLPHYCPSCGRKVVG
jgi:hypothetical protein